MSPSNALAAGEPGSGDRLRLQPREHQHQLGRRSAVAPPTAASSSTCDGIATGSMPDGTQRREPGRGGRGEVEAHGALGFRHAAPPMLGRMGAGTRWVTCAAARSNSTLPTSRTGGSPWRGSTGASSSSPTRFPGERVVARVSDDDKPKFWRAETVRVLEASPHRRPHPWAEAALDRDPAERAGGRRVRPHRHRAPARAQGAGAARGARPLRRGRARHRGRAAPRTRGRHRMAHPRAPARVRRRRGRPLCRAVAHGHPGHRSARSRSTSCARSPRSTSGSPPAPGTST